MPKRQRYLVASADEDGFYLDVVVAKSPAKAYQKVRAGRPYRTYVDMYPPTLSKQIRHLVDLLAQPLDQIDAEWKQVVCPRT